MTAAPSMLLRQAAPYRRPLALLSLLMLLETAVALALPWAGGRIATTVLSDGSAGVRPLLAALLGLFAVQAALKLGNSYLMGRTSARLLADLRVRLYDHLQSLPMAFFHGQRHGDIVALVTHEIAQFAGFITSTMVRVGPLVLTAAGAMVLMARIDAGLAFMVALLVPLFFIVLKLIGRKLRPLGEELQQADATAIAISTENLSMVGLIKVHARELFESDRYRRQLGHVTQLSDRQHLVYSMIEPAAQFTAGAAVIILLALATDRIGAGAMTPAQLVGFLLYAAVMIRPVATLATVYAQHKMASGTLARLQRVLAEPAEAHPHAGAMLPAVRGDIEIRDVQFSYPGRGEALRGVSLRIAAGETIAITGRNGSGKSTLAHLLLRLHEPDAGRVLVDGVDIASVSLHSLRTQIGIVPQHVLLFNGSIRDNIAYGMLDATHADIERAAHLAHADEFVRGLPQGFDTQVGDNGVRLSGGQRQRIALARALLKNPRILILDEATSMFDPESEQLFIARARDAIQLATVIIITHRPATLAMADRTVEISEGRIA
jgi:ATP-binding cassette, subfamily B, bacterial